MGQNGNMVLVAQNPAGNFVPVNVDDDGNLLIAAGAGGGEAVSIADGADITQGAKADAAWNGVPGAASVVAVLKAMYGQLAALIAGYSFHNFVANTAGLAVKGTAGVAGAIIVNTAGVTSSVALYDGASTGGIKLGTFDSTALRTIPLNVAFATGLFAVLAGGTPADVTVTYR